MRTDGRTDIFRKSFLFSSWSRIYILVYTYLDYFSNFIPILTKVSIPFFLWKWVWKTAESIEFYNKTKFGVDVMDQMARKYSTKSSSRRWPLQVFFNILDLAGINAWILYKETTGEKISRKNFLKNICGGCTKYVCGTCTFKTVALCKNCEKSQTWIIYSP